ncbi:MAG: TonB C-terminal domain-containing protein, partial [Thermodesulfobacteriota bacterium]
LEKVRAVWVEQAGQGSGLPGDLEAVYVVRFAPGNDVPQGWFKKKSGRREFDRRAEAAVALAAPLPPLPASLKESGFEIMLRFTREGPQE